MSEALATKRRFAPSGVSLLSLLHFESRLPEGFAGFYVALTAAVYVFPSMLSSGTRVKGKTTVTASGHSRLLKILHIDPERHWGGGEAQVLGLLSYLAEGAHRNDLLKHPDGRLFQQSQALSVRTIPLVVRNDLDLRPVPRLRRLIRDENYDIIHFHTKRAHALSFWLSHGAPRPKYVVTRRMDYPEANNWYTRCLYNRKVEGVVAISRKILSCWSKRG
jgi:hypothetical protein